MPIIPPHRIPPERGTPKASTERRPEAGPGHRKARKRAVVLTVGTERADAVAEALSYWLSASTDNYGSGAADPALDLARDHVRNVLDLLLTTDQRSV